MSSINRETGWYGYTIDTYGVANNDQGETTTAIFTVNYAYHINNVDVKVSDNENDWGARMGDGTIIPLSSPVVLYQHKTNAVIQFTLSTPYASNTPCDLMYLSDTAYISITDNPEEREFKPVTITGKFAMTTDAYGAEIDSNGEVKKLIATIYYPYFASNHTFEITKEDGNWSAQMGNRTIIPLKNPTVLAINKDNAVVLFDMEKSYPSNSPCLLLANKESAYFVVTPISDDFKFIAVEDIVDCPKDVIAGLTVDLSGTTVKPYDATNKQIEWSFIEGSDKGTITGNKFYAKHVTGNDQKVKLRATIKNGSGIGQDKTKDFEIKIIENKITIKADIQTYLRPIVSEINQKLSVIANVTNELMKIQWYYTTTKITQISSSTFSSANAQELPNGKESTVIIPTNWTKSDYYVFAKLMSPEADDVYTKVCHLHVINRCPSIKIVEADDHFQKKTQTGSEDGSKEHPYEIELEKTTNFTIELDGTDTEIGPVSWFILDDEERKDQRHNKGIFMAHLEDKGQLDADGVPTQHGCTISECHRWGDTFKLKAVAYCGLTKLENTVVIKTADFYPVKELRGLLTEIETYENTVQDTTLKATVVSLEQYVNEVKAVLNTDEKLAALRSAIFATDHKESVKSGSGKNVVYEDQYFKNDDASLKAQAEIWKYIDHSKTTNLTGHAATNQNITWEIVKESSSSKWTKNNKKYLHYQDPIHSNEEMYNTEATIDSNGKITAKKPGWIKVRATIKNGLAPHDAHLKKEETDVVNEVNYDFVYEYMIHVKQAFIGVTDLTLTSNPSTLHAGGYLRLDANISDMTVNNGMKKKSSKREINFKIKNAGTTGAALQGNTLIVPKEGTVSFVGTVPHGTINSENKEEGSDFNKEFNFKITKDGFIPVEDVEITFTPEAHQVYYDEDGNKVTDNNTDPTLFNSNNFIDGNTSVKCTYQVDVKPANATNRNAIISKITASGNTQTKVTIDDKEMLVAENISNQVTLNTSDKSCSIPLSILRPMDEGVTQSFNLHAKIANGIKSGAFEKDIQVRCSELNLDPFYPLVDLDLKIPKPCRALVPIALDYFRYFVPNNASILNKSTGSLDFKTLTWTQNLPINEVECQIIPVGVDGNGNQLTMVDWLKSVYNNNCINWNQNSLFAYPWRKGKLRLKLEVFSATVKDADKLETVKVYNPAKIKFEKMLEYDVLDPYIAVKDIYLPYQNSDGSIDIPLGRTVVLDPDLNTGGGLMYYNPTWDDEVPSYDVCTYEVTDHCYNSTSLTRTDEDEIDTADCSTCQYKDDPICHKSLSGICSCGNQDNNIELNNSVTFDIEKVHLASSESFIPADILKMFTAKVNDENVHGTIKGKALTSSNSAGNTIKIKVPNGKQESMQWCMHTQKSYFFEKTFKVKVVEDPGYKNKAHDYGQAITNGIAGIQFTNSSGITEKLQDGIYSIFIEDKDYKEADFSTKLTEIMGKVSLDWEAPISTYDIGLPIATLYDGDNYTGNKLELYDKWDLIMASNHKSPEFLMTDSSNRTMQKKNVKSIKFFDSIYITNQRNSIKSSLNNELDKYNIVLYIKVSGTSVDKDAVKINNKYYHTEIISLGNNLKNRVESWVNNLTLTCTASGFTSLKNFGYNFTGLTKISNIPSNITYLEGFMNNCTSFNQDITIPSKVTGTNCLKYFLRGCTSFNSNITFKNTTLQGICCMYGFLYGCTSFNKSFTIPSSVTGDAAFQRFMYGCTSFNQAITFPANAVGLNLLYDAYAECSSLNQNITLPNNIWKKSGGLYGFLKYASNFHSTITISNPDSASIPDIINEQSFAGGKDSLIYKEGITFSATSTDDNNNGGNKLCNLVSNKFRTEDNNEIKFRNVHSSHCTKCPYHSTCLKLEEEAELVQEGILDNNKKVIKTDNF